MISHLPKFDRERCKRMTVLLMKRVTNEYKTSAFLLANGMRDSSHTSAEVTISHLEAAVMMP